MNSCLKIYRKCHSTLCLSPGRHTVQAGRLLCITDSSDLKYDMKHLGQIEQDIPNQTQNKVEF